MNKIVICLVIFVAFIVSGCSTAPQTPKLVAKLRSEIKKTHGLKDGEIIAKFDLEKIENSSDKLFHPNYGGIVNNAEENSKFLSNFTKKYRHKDLLQTNAYQKIGVMNELLIKLDNQHKLLASSIRAKIHNISKYFKNNTKTKNHKKEDYVAMLASLHNATKFIPIFSPVTQPIITSKFGPRFHPHKKKIENHTGLDMAGARHCKIYASGEGKVEAVAKTNSYGNMVIIRHDKDIKTRYAHLSHVFVKTGDKILLGQRIGQQGCTGTSRGEHLHLEILVRDKPVDPLPFLTNSL